MTRTALLPALFLAAPLLAQSDPLDEPVVIPRGEVREILQELKRLRGELLKMDDRLIGCRA